ncbi:MAG: hypothetical protein JJU46_00770 [Balneolaceae bacterium]|nr:hypothetical protein [Balneolaceae bacterium]
MKSFFYGLILTIIGFHNLSAQVSEIDRFSDIFTFPEKIIALSEDKIITVEPQLSDNTINLIDLRDGTVINSLRQGNGPGEVTNAEKLIAVKEDIIWIWDSGHARGIITNHDLNVETEVRASGRSPMFALPLGDEHVGTWSVFSRSDLANIYELHDYTISEINNSVELSELREFEDLINNPLAGQGPSEWGGGAVFRGFNYSSLIAEIRKDGSVRLLGSEMNISFPQADESTRSLEAPDHSEYPEATLSMALNNDYLFVLHSGKKFDASIFRRAFAAVQGKLDELERDYGHSDQLIVYSRESGELVKEITLPEPASDITAYNNVLFTYTYKQDTPEVIRYEIDL